MKLQVSIAVNSLYVKDRYSFLALKVLLIIKGLMAVHLLLQFWPVLCYPTHSTVTLHSVETRLVVWHNTHAMLVSLSLGIPLGFAKITGSGLEAILLVKVHCTIFNSVNRTPWPFPTPTLESSISTPSWIGVVGKGRGVPVDKLDLF